MMLKMTYILTSIHHTIHMYTCMLHMHKRPTYIHVSFHAKLNINMHIYTNFSTSPNYLIQNTNLTYTKNQLINITHQHNTYLNITYTIHVHHLLTI